MFFNQQNNGLQFSPEQPNPTFYVQGAPFSVPFQNQFPPIVNGYVIKLLQDNAQKNPLRCYMFNKASDNAWQNDFYYMLLSSTTALAEAMAATPSCQNQPQETIVATAANEVTTCATATIAMEVPQVKNMMGAGIDAEIQRLIQRQQQLADAVQRHQQGSHSQPAFGQQGGFNQPNQWNNQPQSNWPGNQQQPQGGSSWQAAHRGSGWPYNNNSGGGQPAGNPNINWGRYAGQQSTIAQQNAYASPNTGGYNGRSGLKPQGAAPAQPQPQAQEPLAQSTNAFAQSRGRSSQGPQQPTGGGQAIVEEMFDNMAGDNVQNQPPVNQQQRAFAQRVEQQRAQQALTPEPLSEPTVVPGDHSVDRSSIDEDRPYDYVRLKDGTEIRPAHSSGWELTWTIEQPWPVAFDPTTHMKFHLRIPQADGTFIVKETIKAIAENEQEVMEYLQHEIRQRKPYQLDTSKKVLPANWVEMADLAKPQVVIDPEDHSETPVETPEVKIIPVEIEAHSFQEAEIKYLNEVIAGGSANFEGKVREYYFREMLPVAVDGPMIGVMLELGKKTTLVQAANFLGDHLEREQITPKLYNVLNEAFTKRVNETLSVNLGYGNSLEIESFVDDIEDLGDALREDNMGLLWTILNSERGEDVIKSVSNILKGDEYWDYLAKLGSHMTRQYKTEVNCVLARYEKVSVTHVPWALEIYDENAHMLKASEMPEAHAACVALLERTGASAVKFSRHYLVDIYDRVVEVLPGYLGMNSVLVRSVKL